MNQVFDRAVKETGAALDSEKAGHIKDATKSAVATARKVSLYLTDLNGDGKVDGEYLKLAAEKAGIAWDKIDPDITKMIDPNAKLSVSRQAIVLGISRGSDYYQPRPVSDADLKLMHRIDKLHMEFPFAGSRMARRG